VFEESRQQDIPYLFAPSFAIGDRKTARKKMDYHSAEG
jgi:hypothetical protein